MKMSIVAGESGFTLLEVLLALTIFAVGMLGIAGVQIQSLGFNRGSNTRTTTTAIAQGVMEQILARPGNDPLFESDQNNLVWDLDPNSAATSLTLPEGGTYTATWSVDSNAPVIDLATITVTVSGPLNRTVILTNYRSFW